MIIDTLTVIQNSFFVLIQATLKYTIPLTAVSFTFGLCIALVVAFIRLYAPTPLRIIAFIYVVIFRGTPLLVQLFVIFYGLPWLKIVIDPIPSAIIGFSLHVGAYASETIRASLQAVPDALLESGLSIGFTRAQNFWYVRIPQAARSVIPPLFNTLIDLVKSTSLASLILVPELLRRSQEFAVTTNRFLLMYIEAAFIYLTVCLMLEWIQKKLELRFAL